MMKKYVDTILFGFYAMGLLKVPTTPADVINKRVCILTKLNWLTNRLSKSFSLTLVILNGRILISV